MTDFEERVALEYGIHSIRVESPGYETVRANIRVGSEMANIAIELDRIRGFRWIEAVSNEIVEDAKPDSVDKPINKTGAAALLIAERLQNGMVPASTLLEALQAMNLSDRTIREAKKEIRVKSIKKNGQWYWSLPDDK